MWVHTHIYTLTKVKLYKLAFILFFAVKRNKRLSVESSAFAWLAMKRDRGKLISKAYLTGAKNSRKLGVIYR